MPGFKIITAANIRVANLKTGSVRSFPLQLMEVYGATLLGEVTSNGSMRLVAQYLASLRNDHGPGSEVELDVAINNSVLGDDVDWSNPKSIAGAMGRKYNEVFKPAHPLDVDAMLAGW